MITPTSRPWRKWFSVLDQQVLVPLWNHFSEAEELVPEQALAPNKLLNYLGQKPVREASVCDVQKWVFAGIKGCARLHFINMISSFDCCKAHLYADDSTIYYIADSVQLQLINNLQRSFYAFQKTSQAGKGSNTIKCMVCQN